MSTTQNSAEKNIGRLLSGKYRLLRVLGEGGMGAVYEAEHTLIGRRFAVKVMHSLFTSIPDSVERFLREARAAGSIGHPNIIEVQDVGEEEDGTVYIVMELLTGETLEDVLNREGTVRPEQAIAIILQVLSALHAAHKKGILHRDLKPDNIFLAIDARGREEVKLFDFGVAKFQNLADDSLGLTKTGTVLGTPYYLAPEQAKGGKNIDEGIDIWSVGVVLYEMLTGQLPFEGDNYNEVLGKILLEEHEPIRSIVPEVPQALAAIAEKALAKDPKERYRAVSEMIEDLLPLHDADAEMMSTTVFTALRDSFLPVREISSLELEELDPDSLEPITNDSLVPIDRSLAQTVPSEPPPEPYELAPQRVLTARRVLAAGAIGAVLILILIVIIFGRRQNADSPPLNGPNDLGAAPTVSAAAMANKEPGRNPRSMPEKEPASSQDNTATQSQDIQILLAGAPEGAEAYLDNEKTVFPAKLSPSDTPMILKVIATGHEPFIKAIVPNRDQRIDIAMKKKKKEKSKTPKRRSRTFNKAQKGGKVWAKNPFGD